MENIDHLKPEIIIGNYNLTPYLNVIYGRSYHKFNLTEQSRTDTLNLLMTIEKDRKKHNIEGYKYRYTENSKVLEIWYAES
jgi:hypothetical protein